MCSEAIAGFSGLRMMDDVIIANRGIVALVPQKIRFGVACC